MWWTMYNVKVMSVATTIFTSFLIPAVMVRNVKRLLERPREEIELLGEYNEESMDLPSIINAMVYAAGFPNDSCIGSVLMPWPYDARSGPIMEDGDVQDFIDDCEWAIVVRRDVNRNNLGRTEEATWDGDAITMKYERSLLKEISWQLDTAKQNRAEHKVRVNCMKVWTRIE